jgi:uncharacterized alpha-E superfamily protein
MLSRSADSLFWLNRYVERSEGLLRILHTTYVLSLDKGPYVNDSWKTIMHIFSTLPLQERGDFLSDPDKVLQHVLLEKKNVNSLTMVMTRARENARGMQDHLTKEVWEQVNYMYHTICDNSIAKQLQGNKQIPVVEKLLKNCLLYTGIVDSTMPRGMSWNFMNLGKYIERCMLTLELMEQQIIDHDLSDEKDILYWRVLLFSLSGYEFHLKNYRSSEANYNVMHQAILNGLFPHSVLYSLNRIRKYLDNVVDENTPSDPNGLKRQFGRICSSVEFADLDTIKKIGPPEFLHRTRDSLRDFTWALSQTYFSYS